MPSTGTNRIGSFSILVQLVLSRDFLFHCICLYRKNNLVTTVRNSDVRVFLELREWSIFGSY